MRLSSSERVEAWLLGWREIDAEDSHSSEIGLDGYQHFREVIRNDGSLEDLRQKVGDFMAGLKLHDEWGLAVS